jgi:hypothetical protein
MIFLCTGRTGFALDGGRIDSNSLSTAFATPICHRLGTVGGILVEVATVIEAPSRETPFFAPPASTPTTTIVKALDLK